jgi:hypothetical protein
VAAARLCGGGVQRPVGRSDGRAQGKTNAGIEAVLHLSSSTVEKHVSAIFDKLGLAEEPVHRRVAAVLAFLDHPPPEPQPSGTRSP